MAVWLSLVCPWCVEKSSVDDCFGEFMLLASLSRAEEFKNLAKWFPRLGFCLVLLPVFGVLFRSFVRILCRTPRSLLGFTDWS